MARIRTVKPSFNEDEKVARLSGFAMVLWVGMWQQADDRTGVCPGTPRWLNRKVFPLRDFGDSTVTGMMFELEREELVKFFVCRRQLYAQSVNFLKHQSISKPQVNKYPDPASDQVLWVSLSRGLELVQEYSGNVPGVFREDSGSVPGGSPEDSGREREEEEEEEREETDDCPSPSPAGDLSLNESVRRIFDHYMALWPKRGRYSLTDDRRKKIKSRLAEFTEEEIKRALSNTRLDTWPERKDNCDIELFLRSQAKVEHWLNYEGGGAEPGDASDDTGYMGYDDSEEALRG